MRILNFGAVLLLCGCTDLSTVGQPPEFTPITQTRGHSAMINQALPVSLRDESAVDRASLWSGERQSLLGDRRAMQPGDILTVVIEIDDQAEISNATQRSRSGNQNLGVPDFFGLPQRLDESLPEGAATERLVGINGASNSSGDGSVRRNEKLTLRVAATVVERLPNGVLAISGTQELRVNFELRELLVTGYVRPADISRQNEITYDKIASARVSYGGRGQITDVQQPRYGQQILDAVLPF
ncbi:MAG: flagellar basal body L-ring protein FlgH [Pseudomonadota bacterium]